MVLVVKKLTINKIKKAPPNGGACANNICTNNKRKAIKSSLLPVNSVINNLST